MLRFDKKLSAALGSEPGGHRKGPQREITLILTEYRHAFDKYIPDSTLHEVYRQPTRVPTEKQGTGRREETPWTLQDWENLERQTDSFCPGLRRCKCQKKLKNKLNLGFFANDCGDSTSDPG